MTRCAIPRLISDHSLPGHDARNQVEGQDALGAAAVGVDGERHAALQQHRVDEVDAVAEFGDVDRAQRLREPRVVGPRDAELVGKFIEEVDPLILVEERLH